MEGNEVIIMAKSEEQNMKEFETEGGMFSDTVQLMDLPEPILLHIMSYLGHDFLRHVAPSVSLEWKRLAHSQILWSHAYLSIYSHECWDKSPVEEFVRNILVTPYLHHLTVSLSNCDEDISSSIQAALVSSHCRLYKLSLSVDDYGPGIITFLQQHPELRELSLSDNASDDVYAAGVAATVGRLTPHLVSLNLSLSGLLGMPKAGLLLASPSLPHGGDFKLEPVETALYLPAGSEVKGPAGILDLRNVDNEDCEIGKQDQPDGVLHFEFVPYGIPLHVEPSSPWATTAGNLAALLHAHKHTLKTVKVSLPCKEVYTALAECIKLEELAVVCDPSGAHFCAMLRAMAEATAEATVKATAQATAPTLRRLHLEAPTPLGVQGLAAVLQTLGQHATRLEALELASWRPIQESSAAAKTLFPGFKAMQAMLEGRQGFAALRALHISHMGPVGRAQFLELTAVAAAAAKQHGLSLRRLHLTDCPCSAERSWAECRDRAEDGLRAAMPALEYTTDCIVGFDDRYDIGFMPMYSCDCEQRRPGPRPDRGHRGNRGGRGRGRGGEGHP